MELLFVFLFFTVTILALKLPSPGCNGKNPQIIVTTQEPTKRG